MGQENTLVEIRRLEEAQVTTYIAAQTTPTAITAVGPTVLTLDGTGADFEDVPDKDCRLISLTARFTGGAGLSAAGVAAITWRLTMDSAGDIAVTPEIDTLLLFEAGSTAIASCTAILGQGGLPYRRINSIGTEGELYLHATLDQGTANLRAYLTMLAKIPGPPV